jgi:hypothetical protein
MYGGEGGIRTHEAYRPPLFESGTINHSVTSPQSAIITCQIIWQKFH